jgi:hypothetical protein
MALDFGEVPQMIAQSMTERVARILCKQWGREPDEVVQGERAAVGRSWLGWEAFADEAKDIMAAMREPTEDMNDAIVDVAPDRPHGDYWRAGIDAALAEPSRWDAS